MTITDLKNITNKKEAELEQMKKELGGYKKQKKGQLTDVFSYSPYSQVKLKYKMLKFYVGLQNRKVFEWIMCRIKGKIPKLVLSRRKIIRQKTI